MTAFRAVPADPRPWPSSGEGSRDNSALIIIDMQRDFCDPEGYMGQMGYDLTPLRAPIAPIATVLTAARQAGWAVIHTRQGYRREVIDRVRSKEEDCKSSKVRPGDPGPLGRIMIREEPGWQIIPDLAPIEGEVIVDKTANGAFCDTDLAGILRALEIRHLAFCGNTIDVCVHTTLREANDQGFECLLIADCCGAVSKELHHAAVEMVKVEDGVFGSVTDSATFVAALSALQQ
ncbi:MAG: isochorismatase family cysteine hydrolase [Pseudomonadota bacterium]